MHRHDAPFCTLLRVVSAAASFILVAVAIALFLAPPPVSRWVALLPLSILVACILFTVRGYTVSAGTLLVHRLFWSTRLPLGGFESARAEPDAMRGSIRIFGNGGLFSFSGLYRNRALGSYRAWVTDPSRSVVLRFRDRTWVVSPADPAKFIAELESFRNRA